MHTLWLVTLTAALTVVLVACTPATSEVEADDRDLVGELCEELVPQIESFQDGVDKAVEGDSEGALRQTRFAASSVHSVIEIASRQGLDLDAAGHEWIASVQLAAEAFVTYGDNGFEGFSDEEATQMLRRIDDWFIYAKDRCLGKAA